jgi:hypothetical protein
MSVHMNKNFGIIPLAQIPLKTLTDIFRKKAKKISKKDSLKNSLKNSLENSLKNSSSSRTFFLEKFTYWVTILFLKN